jgi:hypothetical protein
MINPTTKCGVLNDWDLSYYRPFPDGNGQVVGGERTGTLPFMALDLLTDKAWKGNVQRLYRHDLEGFIWILPWVFLQFEGTKRINCRLAGWETGDFRKCTMEKRGLFSELDEKSIPTAEWTAEWELAVQLLYWLQVEEGLRGLDRKAPLLSPKDVFNRFYDVLCKAQQCYPPLEKLMHELKLTPIE